MFGFLRNIFMFIGSIFIGNPAYDSLRRFKFLLGRPSDPGACGVEGVPGDVTEKALQIFCDSFDIPAEQVHCLRPADTIAEIYKAMIGKRSWDDMEYERLAMALEEALGRKILDDEFLAISTIGELQIFLAAGFRRPSSDQGRAVGDSGMGRP